MPIGQKFLGFQSSIWNIHQNDNIIVQLFQYKLLIPYNLKGNGLRGSRARSKFGVIFQRDEKSCEVRP